MWWPISPEVRWFDRTGTIRRSIWVCTYMEDLPAGGSIVDDLLAEFTGLEIFGNIDSTLHYISATWV